MANGLRRTRRPRLTLPALEALTRAMGRMTADDLTDDTDQEQAEIEAADKWLSEMWQFYPEGPSNDAEPR